MFYQASYKYLQMLAFSCCQPVCPRMYFHIKTFSLQAWALFWWLTALRYSSFSGRYFGKLKTNHRKWEQDASKTAPLPQAWFTMLEHFIISLVAKHQFVPSLLAFQPKLDQQLKLPHYSATRHPTRKFLLPGLLSCYLGPLPKLFSAVRDFLHSVPTKAPATSMQICTIYKFNKQPIYFITEVINKNTWETSLGIYWYILLSWQELDQTRAAFTETEDPPRQRGNTDQQFTSEEHFCLSET